MKSFDYSQFANLDRFSQRISELRSSLQGASPLQLAQNTASRWDGAFHLELWGRPIQVSFPDWIVTKAPSPQPPSQMEQALLLYYFNIADGFPIQNRWIAFSDLPDGRFYNQAFQGYTGNELARAFQNDMPAFELAAQSLQGVRQPLGSASYLYWALPRVPILVVYWLGDDEFPASAQLLFDASASHYLTTDSFAILGSAITRRLIAARRSPSK